MRRIPTIDLSGCVDCEACIALCPQVFRKNEAGFVEVADLDEYPEEMVEEAMANCPADCISWLESRND